ncbi:MAG: hypothetical protein F4X54_07350 [Chloroflexi bacterium]|nr:hypothetical protein [Chloroflexota bacterium]MYB84533.1 hypothetical protein [Chloroflexota bacterium]
MSDVQRELRGLRETLLLEEGGMRCPYCRQLALTYSAYGVLHFDEHEKPNGQPCPMANQYAWERRQ